MTEEDETVRELDELREHGEEALAEFFTQHEDQLRQTIRFRLNKRLLGRVDIEDILQDTYLAAAKRLHHYLADPAVSLRVWLRKIALQVLIDVHRHHLQAKMRDANAEVSPRTYADATSTSLAASIAANWSTPSQVYSRQESLRQLQTAFDTLDQVDQEVLAMRHFEGLGNNEVAEILGIQKSAATNRYMRALARLRGILDKVALEQDVPQNGA